MLLSNLNIPHEKLIDQHCITRNYNAFFRNSVKLIIILLISIFLSIDTSAQSTGKADWSDPLALYGDQLTFQILRNGEKAGFHRVSFKKPNKALKLYPMQKS